MNHYDKDKVASSAGRMQQYSHCSQDFFNWINLQSLYLSLCWKDALKDSNSKLYLKGNLEKFLSLLQYGYLHLKKYLQVATESEEELSNTTAD